MNRTKQIGFYRNTSELIERVAELRELKEHELLVSVKAVAVNLFDTMMLSGEIDAVEYVKGTKLAETAQEDFADNFHIIGADASGVVVKVGSNVREFTAGDEVFYSGDNVVLGTTSEYNIVDSRLVGFKPKSIGFAEAASFPLTSLAAYESLFQRISISQDRQQNRGKHILIIGAAGGVGSVAIQLCKWAGLTVIATASREESRAWCKKMGADFVIDHSKDLLEEFRKLDIGGTNYIFSVINTSRNFNAICEIALPESKIVTISEDPISGADLSLFMKKSLTFSYEELITKVLYDTQDLSKHSTFLNHISQLIDEGFLKPTVSKCYNKITIENIQAAHGEVFTRSTIGKIVLENF